MPIPLHIEKMIYGGDGLARLPANSSGKSKTVFVPFVLAGEDVSAALVEERPAFARARAEQIVALSPQRIPPGCPYFGKCGGCHYQHTSYEHQLEIKQAILLESLQRIAKFEWQQPLSVHPSPPWNYRNRTRVKVHAASPGDFALGYYRLASHQLLPVEQCPISSPLINRALAAVWALGRESAVPASIREIEFFASAGDAELLLEVYATPLAGDLGESLAAFYTALQSRLPECKGMTVFSGSEAAVQGKVAWSRGETDLLYRTAADGYHVRAGSFFQTNRFLTDKLIDLVIGEASGKLALDLYAGTGLFSLPLARRFSRVVAVESAPASFADLRANAAENVACVRSSTEDYLQRPQPPPDFVVVDPPRAGLGEKVTRSLADSKTPRIAYVSCDPATLARDLRQFLASGYRLEAIHLVDLFPQTFHIETVAHLVR